MSNHLQLTVLGTADLHGHVLNWDYFAAREFDPGQQVGLAAISTLVRGVRERAGERTVTVDAGDTIGGTQLAYYYARVEPITDTRIHPMAAAMNAIGYDAAVPGNHDFDYGFPLLRAWHRQLDFPLVAANAVTRTGEPVFSPYLIRTLPGDERGPVRVGILGLTNPGTAVWDRCRLAGELIFPGIVEQARYWVPRIREQGADLVLVVAHSGVAGLSSYGDAVPFPENAAALIATEVAGVDAVLAGHAHEEIDELVLTNEPTGKQVVITEPMSAGRRLSVIELELRRSGPGRLPGWAVEGARSFLLNANTAEQDREVVRVVRDAHDAVVRYLDTPLGTCTTEISTAAVTWQPTLAADLVQHVQAGTVRRALRGSEHDRLPVLSLGSLWNRHALIPVGQVLIRHLTALYPFDNLLMAVRMNGACLREYLEASAAYFRQIDGVGPYPPGQVTNAPTPSYRNGAPDYNYDVLAGLYAPVEYDIDIAAEPGHRIRGLRYGGKPIADDAEFVVAVNDYRQSGGGSFPHIDRAPVVYDARQEIRQLLIAWVRAHGGIDPTEFAGSSGALWRLVAGTEPVRILDPHTEHRTAPRRRSA